MNVTRIAEKTCRVDQGVEALVRVWKWADLAPPGDGEVFKKTFYTVVGCTEQRHVPHGGRYKIFFPPFSIILKLCIRGEDVFTPYTRSVTLILVSFLS